MPTTSVSFRVDAELLAELDALTRALGKDRSAVLTELVRSGLEMKRGQAADVTATTLEELVTEVKRLKARVKRSSAPSVLGAALEDVGDKLAQVVTEQQERALGLMVEEVRALRQHVRRSFGNTLRVAFKLTEEQAQEQVRKTFDT